MKKLLLIAMMVVTAGTVATARTYTTHEYAENSVMKSGKWVKISVDKSGLYRIPADVLATLGLTPANARIYGYGGAMKTQDFSKDNIDDLPEIAAYNDGNGLVFYAQGPVSWSYNSYYKELRHTDNPYSQKGYYFISNAGDGSPKRIATADSLSASNYTATTFTDAQLYEKDLVNLVDPAGVAGGGREWYGENFAPGNTKNFSFNFPNLVTSNKPSISWCCAANGGVSSTFTLKLGSSTASMILEAVGSNLVNAKTITKRTTTLSATGDNINLSLSYASGSSTCKGYLNYIEVNATRNLTLANTSTPLFFQNLEHVGQSGNTLYQLRGAGSSTQIWDITHPEDMQRIPATLNEDTLQFIVDNQEMHRLVAVNATAGLSNPTIVGTVSNQNLHQLKNIQYVVITYPEFYSAAKQLADLHSQKDNITTAVVTTDQVYNEFSSGTPDATAYRWLMKMLYDRYRSGASSVAPRWLVLMGDGSFDNRKILTTSPQPYVLTYQTANSTEEPKALPCDDYFTWLDDDEGADDNGNMDAAVGRLPVSSLTEAAVEVAKIGAYMNNQNYGNWHNQLVFLADDGDLPGLLHTWQADSVVNYIKPLTNDFQINRIYEEAYNQEVTASGESYPLAQNRFNNLMKNGLIYFNYTGHGSPTNATSEGMLSMDIVSNMSNENQGLWALATCSFSHYDRSKECIAEAAILNPTGGAIDVYSSTRTVYATQNLELNKQVSKALFTQDSDGQYPTIGEACQWGKNVITDSTTLLSNDNGNRLAYTLLGDPGLRLKYPVPYQVMTDSINGAEVSENDTVRALQGVTVSGHVADAAGSVIGDFNGKVNLQFFDKEELVTCKDNDNVLGDNQEPYQYYDRQSTLFKGNADVQNGRFSINFMLPKDIKYNYGSGRFLFYAYDPTSGMQAHGNCEQFMVGGSSDNIVLENDGPDMVIYLNTTAFESGDQVNTTPKFYAILSDNTGINTAGSGIGHDLELMIDNDPEQTYSLNDYFETGTSFRNGTVQYQLAEQTEGKHTLQFRAWDLLNNSTTKSLDYEVVQNLEPEIVSVMCYPNPVARGGLVHFAISHDRPDANLSAELRVYDLYGRLVHTQQQSGGDELQWNVNGLGGGVYIYQIRLKEKDTEWSTRSSKIIVY